MTSVKVPLKVQKRSGFDKSHHNALSQLVGTITPILVDEVIPNSKVYLKYAMAGSLPPLAVDTYMKVYYDVRAFFVPFRLLWGGTESWFTNYPYNVVRYDSVLTKNNIFQVQSCMPTFSFDSNANSTDVFGPGTLSDYLGYKFDPSTGAQADQAINISLLPFLAYHRVCDDWFRQPNITRSCFARPTDYYAINSSTGGYTVASAPFIAPQQGSASVFLMASGYDITTAENLLLADNISVLSLRQANYDYDYFTNALPSAQLGNPLTVSTSGGSFTIASLRAANSLQQFSEVNQLAGSNMVDVVKARYGANLHDSMANRCIYLGGARIDIASKTVEVNATASGGNNPFRPSVGSTAARAIIQGSDLIIDDFVAQEPGYIFVVGTIIPKVTYGSGIRRYLTHYLGAGSITDMANPMLQNVGNQPIYTYELDSSLHLSSENGKIFGYTDRYAEFMTMEDEVHSNMVYGQLLGSFVAQRYFSPGDRPVIGTNFLSVPIGALNNITNVTAQLSAYGFYGQFAFDYKVSMPLAQYSLPSLQNPAYEHGKTVMVHRGGFRF